MWRQCIKRLGWTAALVAGTLLAADRGITVKVPADAGLVNYDPKRFHALVIGISEYKYWMDLRCAADDAKAMAATLRDIYGYGDVKTLLNEQATRKGILEAIDQYNELGEEDSLLIYYAGHGWMDKNKTGFWVPTDATEDDKFSYIPNSQIVNDYFKKYKVRHLLVIADSCFSGSMLRGKGSDRQEDWQLPSGFRKPSRWIMTSGDLAPVPDDTGSGHSPFATRLLQQLKHSDQPAFGVQDLYVYVRKNLESGAICQPLDTPAHMPGGEFAFCRLAAEPLTPPVKAPTAVPPPDPIKTGPPKPGSLSSFTPPPHPAKVDPPTGAKTAVTPPPSPPSKPETGTLVIRSPVGGIATIDSVRVIDIKAEKACTVDNLKPGLHTIKVTSGRKTWQSTVNIEIGKIQDVRVDIAASMEVQPVRDVQPIHTEPDKKPSRPKVH